ncbi:M23 family metallopeptidase, partial [Bacteroides cellulosilyticus]
PYGLRIDTFSKKRSRHNGIDLRAKGEEAYAMLSGVVVKVGYDRRSGNFVTLRHGDFTVSYCHLSQTLVTKGTHVRPGIIIALTGNSGRSTGPHLHLTLKDTKKGRAIDPSILLNLIKHPL